MTSFEPIIERLSVEAFRGFRDLRHFDLSAAAVVVTGPNGTGKTSFFDALQWGLLGSLQRLESLRSRRNAEYVVNQYRLGRKATVEIGLRVPAGSITIRRTGDQSGSTLELRRPGSQSVFGAEAEAELRQILLPRSDLSLESALMTSGLMQQDVMRRVLEAKASDRYQQLSTVLGLSKLEDFEEAVRSLARQASDRARAAKTERDRLAEAARQAKVRLGTTESQLASRPSVIAVREEVLGLLSDVPKGVVVDQYRVSLEGPSSVAQLAVDFGSAAATVGVARALAARSTRLQESLIEEPSDEELASHRDAVTYAAEELSAAEASREAVQMQLDSARQAAAEVAQLAALAVPMLSDQCPVCGQAIDREEVEKQLRERAESTGTIIDLQERVAGGGQAVAAAIVLARSAEAALSAVQVRAAKWAEVRSIDVEALNKLAELVGDTAVAQVRGVNVRSLEVAGAVVEEYLLRTRRALLELLETFNRQADQGVIDRALAEIESVEGHLLNAEKELATESSRAQTLQTLSEQSVAARVEVTEARLRAIQPLVTNIFERLDPHPAFKAVEFELNTYYRKGTTSPLVTDAVAGVSADPLLIFSTSQANIVALSYFIAMSLSAEATGLPFLLLDDPVQSMDDVNVLGFADLCRHLRLRRQLIVSTHERRFAGLLERKLAPRAENSRTKLIRFTGWDRSGPTVEERVIEPQLLEDPMRVIRLVS